MSALAFDASKLALHRRRKRVNVVLMTAANSVRRPAILAELAWARWQAGQVDDLSSLAPIYLHAAEPIPG